MKNLRRNLHLPAIILLQVITVVTALNNNDAQSRESFFKMNPSNQIISDKIKSSVGDDIFDIKNVDEAVKYGLDTVEDLLTVKEPVLFRLGLYLDGRHPASKVAEFGKPNGRAKELSRFGMATLEATKKILQSFPANVSRQLSDFPTFLKSKILKDDCPLNGRPRCPLASKKYRTYDGTCNNLENPWKGATLLPMQRYLPPAYEDGIQSIRLSVLGAKLPSAREVSTKIHKDKYQELSVVTLMFMQWGQFIDHDITSVVKSRGFNGSIPRCCENNGQRAMPREFLHPSCLPIEVPKTDRFFAKFGIGCMEFLRSAPSTRINCDLGWREQINQVTSFIDASTIYGNDFERADSIRTFMNGKIIYGRSVGGRPLQPPDPPGGELCTAGALTTDCFQSGDGRVTEQPGLMALHTVWIRYHNKVATVLSKFNAHWSDEKVYQETRKIVYSLIQHITYNEFIPILLGPQVLRLFDLELQHKGFYDGYDPKADPAIANSFSAAAYRFGHSMVQNSFVRTDAKHRPIFNNVSLHEEFSNFENIWSFGSVDRTLLGFCNQPTQRRDEFVCDELSNHLFQSADMPFGMDLTAINVQRGRDHGIPPYTSFRRPCGLSPIETWEELGKVFGVESARKFSEVYRHVDDVDLFSGGLAEKPVRGAVVGPTFACIIAQQFLNLRKGDRFWYENGDLPSSFTPAQLQQIRRATFSNVLCGTMNEFETIQPFVFLAPNVPGNERLSCDDSTLNNFDLSPWIEVDLKDTENWINSREGVDVVEEDASQRKRKTKLKYGKRRKPKPSATPNASQTVIVQNHKGAGDSKGTYAEPPIAVNIKIEYYPSKLPSSSVVNKKNSAGRPSSSYLEEQPVSYPIFVQSSNVPTIYNQPPSAKPTFTINSPTSNSYYEMYDYKPIQMLNRPTANSYDNSASYRPTGSHNRPSYRPADSYDEVLFEEQPFVTSKHVYKPNVNHFLYVDPYVSTKRPFHGTYEDDISGSFYRNKYKQSGQRIVYSKGHVQKVDINDKLDFKSRLVDKNGADKRFVKISSVKSQASISANSALINTVLQREGDDVLTDENDASIRLVEMNVVPSDNEQKNWLIFNESENLAAKLKMPDLNSQTACSDEVPHPIRTW